MNKDREPKETEKPKGDNQQASVNVTSESTPYYVPHLKEYRSIKNLTQEDRESIADNLYGPSKSKERNDLIQHLKKLAEGREETSNPIEDGDPVSKPDDNDTETEGKA